MALPRGTELVGLRARPLSLRRFRLWSGVLRSRMGALRLRFAQGGGARVGVFGNHDLGQPRDPVPLALGFQGCWMLRHAACLPLAHSRPMELVD